MTAAISPPTARPFDVRATTRRRWIASALAGMVGSVGAASAAEPLRMAPPLRATLLDGRAFSLQQAAGKVLIVNFWVTWCGPCRVELPALDAFRIKYRDRGLEIIAISLDEARLLPEVRQALRGLGLDAAMAAESSFEGYGRIWRFPTTFIVDREGRLRTDITSGVASFDLPWLERHVAPLLGT